MHWESEPDEYYLVIIMHKDDQNQFFEVESLKTKNPYARIDLKYTRETDYYFTVTALDENTGVVNGSSDPIPAQNPFAFSHNPMSGTVQGIDPNADTYNRKNTIKCNGRNYAWELDLFQFVNSGTQPQFIQDFEPGVASRLTLRPTSSNINDVNGNAVPFYQAMTNAQFDLLSDTHPYKMQSNGVDWYKKIPIIDGLQGGPFFDALNNLVPSGTGILIEKKLDQYEHFNGDVTNLFYPSASFPNMDIYGWYSSFNNCYAPESVNGNFPTSTTFSDQYGVPSELTCTSAFGIGSGGETVAFGEEDFVEMMIDCWDENSTVLSYGDCLDDIFNNGFSVTDVLLVPLVKDGISHHLIRDSITKKMIDLDSLRRYDVGLYEAQIFTNSENIFHAIFEKLAEADVREDKDFVSMSINPNPIENNTLNLIVKTMKEMTAQLFIYTLNNDQIYSGVINLAVEEDFSNSFDISNYTTVPFNQIKVKLVFNDQSSMIQKTGVR